MALLMMGYSLAISACSTQKETAQDSTFQVDYLVTGNFKILEVDKLGFIYLVNSRNEILKYDTDYKLLFRYSIRSLGDITSLNVSNPQKLFVYYGDYNQIVLLENTLSEIKRLDLESLEIYNISGMTVGRDNFIWLFDNANLRLLKINERGEIFLSSNEQDPTLRAFVDEMPDLYAYENQRFLSNGNLIAVYDEFGVHQKNIRLNSKQLQFAKNKVLFLQDQSIKSYNLQVDFLEDSNVSTVMNFQGTASSFHFNNSRLLLIDASGLRKVE